MISSSSSSFADTFASKTDADIYANSLNFRKSSVGINADKTNVQYYRCKTKGCKATAKTEFADEESTAKFYLTKKCSKECPYYPDQKCTPSTQSVYSSDAEDDEKPLSAGLLKELFAQFKTEIIGGLTSMVSDIVKPITDRIDKIESTVSSLIPLRDEVENLKKNLTRVKGPTELSEIQKELALQRKAASELFVKGLPIQVEVADTIIANIASIANVKVTSLYRTGKNYGPPQSLVSNCIISTASESDRSSFLRTAADLRRSNQLPDGLSVFPNRTKQQSHEFKKTQLLASAYSSKEVEIGSKGSWRATDRNGYPELTRYENGSRCKPDPKLMATLMACSAENVNDTEDMPFRRSKLKRQLTTGPPHPAGPGGR
jgi:hypothetical protein